MANDGQSSSPRIAIIGAGIAGISTAIALKEKLGCSDFVIYEMGEKVGGTWRDNTYPGCQCDVPSHCYSLSTDLNPNWTSYYSPQSEILAYWNNLVKKHSIASHIQFNHELILADWDEKKQRYTLTFKSGEVFTVKVLISAIGALRVPRFPTIPGIDAFKGKSFHSAAYDHSVALAGKKVGVFGNACSAAQLIPEISENPTVDVVNFCRTPSWFIPRTQYAYPAIIKWMFRHIPGLMRLYRILLMIGSDMTYILWKDNFKFLRRLAEMLVAKPHVKKTAPKRYLPKLIPSYPFGCKRIIVDPGYLKSLHQPNVNLEWDDVVEFVSDGVITRSGKKYELDVVIFATGFNMSDLAPPVRGRHGTLQEYFDLQGGPAAYKGIAVPGFPNLFSVFGPNVATGHISLIVLEELQINYILKLLRPILAGSIQSAEISPSATDAYNKKIQERLSKTVYTGCLSYYKGNEGNGKNFGAFPGMACTFWWWLRKVDWREYIVVKSS